MTIPRPIHWGILGTARIATRVGAAIRAAKDAELTAIASRSAEKAAAWAGEHGAVRSYGSYEALLDDPDLDAVYIPLPPAMHAEWTIKAARRSKHVLCEKPLAMNADQAEEMAAACRENNVQLIDGVMWLHHPRAADMLRPIREGTLGELKRVTSGFSFRWETFPDESEYRLHRDLGGGALGDLGWYCVGATLWAFDQLPARVFGAARYYNDVDLNFSGLMEFPGGRAASFDCGFDIERRRWLEVAGEKGSLVCDDFPRPWDESRPRFWLHGFSGKIAEQVSAAPIQEVCMIEDMVKIIQTGNLDESWPRRSIDTQRICDALDRAAREERWVDL